MKKKCLILANNSGGVFLFRRELIQGLMVYTDIIISTPFDDAVDELRAMGCDLVQTEIDRRGINPFEDIALIYQYLKIFKNVKPDMAISYTIKPNIYGGFVCRMNNIPYAVNITGLGTAFEKKGMVRKLVVSMYRYSLKKAQVVFFENDSNANMFVAEKIIHQEQAYVLNGAGVNLIHYHIQPYPQNEIFHFLFIGRIMKEKGVDELFSSMSKLIHNGYACVLDVLGELEENYIQIITEHETDGWLKYYGVQMDVRPYIAQSDCFVLPSWHEGMANTNLECAASGRPIITSNIPGCKEAVINGTTGLLCEPKSVDSLYLMMKQMIDIPRDGRKNMGLAGRKHMENKFDKREVVQKTIAQLFKK